MLEVICYTIERATAHIQKNNDAKVAAALIKILNDHAVDGEPISIKYANNSVASMCFTTTHEVMSTLRLTSAKFAFTRWRTPQPPQ